MQEEYQRRPIRPFVLIESTYEGEHNSTPDQIRRQAYWAMLGGACGQFFGNNPIWHFDGPGLYPVKTTWKEALDGTGSRDMTRLRDFFVGLPWHRLEPEKNHEVVTDGYGDGVATALTARTADKRLSVTYIPSTGTESRKLTVDLDAVLRADHRPLVQSSGRAHGRTSKTLRFPIEARTRSSLLATTARRRTTGFWCWRCGEVGRIRGTMRSKGEVPC